MANWEIPKTSHGGFLLGKSSNQMGDSLASRDRHDDTARHVSGILRLWILWTRVSITWSRSSLLVFWWTQRILSKRNWIETGLKPHFWTPFFEEWRGQVPKFRHFIKFCQKHWKEAVITGCLRHQRGETRKNWFSKHPRFRLRIYHTQLLGMHETLMTIGFGMLLWSVNTFKI